MNLFKAFDSVNNSVVITKLQMYGITGINLVWFHCYLSNRKQYISLGHCKALNFPVWARY